MFFFTIACNLSNEMSFPEGISCALQLMIITCEVIGNIRGAFQLAVSLKLADFKVFSLRKCKLNLYQNVTWTFEIFSTVVLIWDTFNL